MQDMTTLKTINGETVEVRFTNFHGAITIISMRSESYESIAPDLLGEIDVPLLHAELLSLWRESHEVIK